VIPAESAVSREVSKRCRRALQHSNAPYWTTSTYECVLVSSDRRPLRPSQSGVRWMTANHDSPAIWVFVMAAQATMPPPPPTDCLAVFSRLANLAKLWSVGYRRSAPGATPATSSERMGAAALLKSHGHWHDKGLGRSQRAASGQQGTGHFIHHVLLFCYALHKLRARSSSGH
jgi:hypothetical protein